jgi:hypothetical protein
MCVAIVQRPGVRIPEKILEAAFRANSDGAGLAYCENGKVVTSKGHMKVDDFIQAYNTAREGRDTTPFLLHCRIATTGKVMPDNCHPFKVKGGVMIHNGSFWTGGRQAELSDTRDFALELSAFLHKANVTVNRAALSGAIGGYNKVAFLYNDGTTVILNEDKGEWKDNVWYSNTYWQHRIR